MLALEEHGPIAGTASALMGTLQLGTGAAIIVLVSLSYNGTSAVDGQRHLRLRLVALTLSFRIMKPKRIIPDGSRPGSSRGRSAAAASPPCAPDRRDNRRRR